MTGYTFGPYFFDSVREVLVLDGVEHSLRHQSARLLTYFLEHAGQEVTKDALSREVWRDAHVSHQAIFQSINQLRRALAEDRDQPRYLKTLPRVGYQWICPVERIVESRSDREDAAGNSLVESNEGSSGSEPVALRAPTANQPDHLDIQLGKPTAPAGWWQNGVLPKIIAATCVFLVLGWWWWPGAAMRNPIRSTEEEGTELRLVLLPFENATDDPRFAWLELGLPEMVAQHLRDLDLQVVPITRVVRAMGEHTQSRDLVQDPSKQARLHNLLGTEWLIFGSLTHAEQGFRLALLGQHRDGRQLQAELFDHKPVEASLLVADRISNFLFGAEVADQLRAENKASAGEEALVRGVQLLYESRLQQAEDWLQQSLAANPELVLARYYMAETLFEMGQYDQAMTHLDSLANKLITNDDSFLQSDVWALRGEINGLRDNRQQAEADYRLAIAYAGDAGDRESAALYQGRLAMILAGQDRVEGAELLFSQAADSLTGLRDLLGLHHLYIDQAGAMVDQASWPRIEAALDEAATLAQQIGEPGLIANELLVRAVLERYFGVGEPKANLAAAKASFEQGSDYGGVVLVLHTLGAYELEDGALLKSRTYGQQALDLVTAHPELNEAPLAYFFSARLAVLDNDADLASEQGQRALTLANQRGNTLDIESLYQLVRCFKDRAEYDRGEPFLAALLEAHQQEPIPEVIPLAAYYWLKRGEQTRASEFLRHGLNAWPDELAEEARSLAQEFNLDLGSPP